MRRLAAVAGLAFLFLTPTASSAAAEAASGGSVKATDGVEVHYSTLGDGSPVLLVSGDPASARATWFDGGVATQLAEKHRVIALEPRSAGNTTPVAGSISGARRSAEDLIAVMDALHVDRAHVHGYSLPADFVTELLDRHSDRLVTASCGGCGLSARPAESRATDSTSTRIPVLAIDGELEPTRRVDPSSDRRNGEFWSYVLPGRSRDAILGTVYSGILSSFVDLYDPGTPPPTHGYFRASDGVNLHYWSMGEGPPVVLIHGFTGNADLWLMNGVAAALRERHRVLALDCRGHGLSDKPHDPARYGLQMAEDVIELLDHLGIEKAHVHGFSLGGWILGRLLDRHQDRLLSATYCGYGAKEVDPELESMVPPERETGRIPATTPGRTPDDPLDLEARAVLSASTARDDEAFAAARAYPWKPGEKLEGEIFPSRLPLDLKQVRVPVLAIMGGLDSPNLKTQRLWRELGDFTMIRLPGRAHVSAVAPGYIQPRYLAATVRFVSAHDPPASAAEDHAP